MKKNVKTVINMKPMHFIQNFTSDKENLPIIHRWLSELKFPESKISNLHLKLIINEAFINACNASKNKYERINIFLRATLSEFEIVITDPGKGFKIEDCNGNFTSNMIGKNYQLLSHPIEELMLSVINKNCIRFYMNKKENNRVEMHDKHRGILSILKIAETVEYHYSSNSLNHLFIAIKRK